MPPRLAARTRRTASAFVKEKNAAWPRARASSHKIDVGLACSGERSPLRRRHALEVGDGPSSSAPAPPAERRPHLRRLGNKKRHDEKSETLERSPLPGVRRRYAGFDPMTRSAWRPRALPRIDQAYRLPALAGAVGNPHTAATSRRARGVDAAIPVQLIASSVLPPTCPFCPAAASAEGAADLSSARRH